jgi:hypothetical protein
VDFQTFIANLYSEVGNKHSETLTQLRRITVRQLKELSQHPYLQMEAETSFQARAGANSYGPSDLGFPGDLFAVERLYYISGTSQRVEIEGPKLMRDLRFGWNSLASSAQYPLMWGYSARQLYIAPPSTTGITLYMDYTRDATRDEETGVEISETSTTEGNPWFDRAELALRYAVLGEYFSQPRWADDAAVQRCLGMRNQHLDTLKTEFIRRKGSGGQAPMILGDIGREPKRPYLYLGGV